MPAARIRKTDAIRRGVRPSGCQENGYPEIAPGFRKTSPGGDLARSPCFARPGRSAPARPRPILTNRRPRDISLPAGPDTPKFRSPGLARYIAIVQDIQTPAPANPPAGSGLPALPYPSVLDVPTWENYRDTRWPFKYPARRGYSCQPRRRPANRCPLERP